MQIPPAWRKPAVELNWRVAPGLPPIRTDPSKLQIMLRNLIHNALKFTHHGMVTVSVSAQPARQQMTFVVQDSGVGIKSEHLSEIFEMFRQAPTGESDARAASVSASTSSSGSPPCSGPRSRSAARRGAARRSASICRSPVRSLLAPDLAGSCDCA